MLLLIVFILTTFLGNVGSLLQVCRWWRICIRPSTARVLHPSTEIQRRGWVREPPFFATYFVQ